MNFPEYDCDNEEILSLLSYLPITTVDDYPWMQKYVDDLQLHYKRAEYELAVISAHMIYMFIVYCYILKKREFDIDKIRADFINDKAHCPKFLTDINPYLYVYKGDKKCFKHLRLKANIVEQHEKVVCIRDSIAHCSGNILSQTVFIDYLRKCIQNIIQLKNIVWNNFKQSKKFNEAIENMIDWNDIIPVYLVSSVEFQDLFEERYVNIIQKKLSDISLWKNTLSKILLQDVTIDELKVDAQDIVISRLDVQDDNAFCFCSANIGFYFETTKNNKLYKRQEHTLINHPFTFEYNFTTNDSSIDLTELPFI